MPKKRGGCTKRDDEKSVPKKTTPMEDFLDGVKDIFDDFIEGDPGGGPGGVGVARCGKPHPGCTSHGTCEKERGHRDKHKCDKDGKEF